MTSPSKIASPTSSAAAIWFAEAGEAAHQVAIARDQPAAPLLEIAERAEAVVFQIEKPPGIVEWLRPPDWGDGLDTRKHG
jgi:hypothetical protein